MKNNIQKRFTSLSYKVFLTLLLAATLPMFMIGSFFYSRTTDILIRKQQAASLNSLSSIANNITSITDSVREISLQLIQDTNVVNMLKHGTVENIKHTDNFLSVQRNTSFYISQRRYLSRIQILCRNSVLFSSDSYSILSFNRFPPTEDVLLTADLRKGGQVWFYDCIPKHYGSCTGTNVISLFRNINSLLDPSQKLGALRIDIQERMLSQLFESEAKTYGASIYLIDKSGTIICSNDKDALYKDITSILPGTLLTVGIVDHIGLSNEDYLVGTTIVENTEWKLVSVMSKNAVLSELGIVRNTLLICVVISLISCVFLMGVFSRSLIKPIMRLTDSMKMIKENRSGDLLSTNRNDEIGVLYQSFNLMIRQLDEMINKVYEHKLCREEKELEALQAQINPHFLYNNLDTAYWMSHIEKAPKTGSIVMALSKLFRLSIRNASQVVSVRTEIEHVKNYITIQQIRFENLVTFQMDIEPETNSLATSRFILQPLVENALYHGVLPNGRNGTIYIRSWSDENTLFFTVEDDGYGGDIGEINGMLHKGQPQGRGFAIHNVHQRIVLRCGNEYGLRYELSRYGGILVTVRQPIQLINSNESEE
jgi:two-component system sensor histidine kinase YesM